MSYSIKLFVFSESRSGSNWLIETLNNHSRIALKKELFQSNKINNYLKERNLTELLYELDYLDNCLNDLTGAFVGCKILFPQAVRFMDFYSFVNHYCDSKFICLTRSNSLKAEVSDLMAQQYNRWHVREPQQNISRIKLDPSYLFRRLEWRRLTKEYVISMLHAYGVEIHHLTYETLFIDTLSEVKTMLKFLNLTFEVDTFSDEMKINSDDLRLLIENYDEVKSFLKTKSPDHYYKMLQSYSGDKE